MNAIFYFQYLLLNISRRIIPLSLVFRFIVLCFIYLNIFFPLLRGTCVCFKSIRELSKHLKWQLGAAPESSLLNFDNTTNSISYHSCSNTMRQFPNFSSSRVVLKTLKMVCRRGKNFSLCVHKVNNTNNLLIDWSFSVLRYIRKLS